jgi:hypothetical protein
VDGHARAECSVPPPVVIRTPANINIVLAMISVLFIYDIFSNIIINCSVGLLIFQEEGLLLFIPNDTIFSIYTDSIEEIFGDAYETMTVAIT